MAELIIIKTKNSEKIEDLLNKEQISYQVFSEQEQEFSQEDKLLQKYQEFWHRTHKKISRSRIARTSR